MKKIFKIFGILLLLALISLSFWCFSNMKDRHPGYIVDLNIRNNSPAELKAGFAAVPITPDVPDRWENKNGDSLVKTGIGGTAVYLNGAIGGLMTTHPSHPIVHPFTGEELFEPTYEKTAAQGNQLALLALDAMQNPSEVIETVSISLVVRTLKLPIKNTLFKLTTAIGVLDRGTSGWMKMRTELAAFQLGSVSFVTVPGEIYPEIINGGVEVPGGNDFGIEPQEVPPVREKMPGKYKFVIGLANDEIGYIIPKSQWDVKVPFTIHF